MAAYTYRDGLDDVHMLHAADDEAARLHLQARVVSLEHDAGRRESAASQLHDLRDERGVELRDPLVHERATMLPQHRSALHALDSRSPLTTITDRDELRAVAARYESAISAYPFAEALELACIDRGRAAGRTMRDAAIRAAADARAAGDALPRRHRDARAQLAEQITRHEARAADAREHIDDMDRQEGVIRDSGRHLDQWVDEHGEDANRWAHAQRALDRLDARDIEQAVAEAIADPPPEIQRTLGIRTGDGPSRERYDDLVGELERRRVKGDLHAQRTAQPAEALPRRRRPRTRRPHPRLTPRTRPATRSSRHRPHRRRCGPRPRCLAAPRARSRGPAARSRASTAAAPARRSRRLQPAPASATRPAPAVEQET